MSINLARKLVAMAFSVSLAFPSLVYAADDEYICEARQNSKAELPVLSKECPVGSGVWGAEPAVNEGLFWIQCGFFSEPRNMKQVKPIYDVISTDVWVKPEKKGYRCLVGPYERYSDAKAELAKVQRVDSYKESFIRDASAKTAPTPVPVPKVEPVPAKPTPAAEKISPAAAALAPVVDQPAIPKPKPNSKPEPMVEKAVEPVKENTVPTETVVARRDVKIGDKYYAIPFLMDGYDQFYMEYGIAWNRLNYERATEVCESQKMRLPSTDEWKLLIDSQVMSQKQWPLHLPYWGMDKQGLFTSGKVTQLTGTSLLNVVCVK